MDRSHYYAQFFIFLQRHPLQSWTTGEGWQPPDVDLNRQCTSGGTGGRECWLCFDLPPWNYVLNSLGLNLSEAEPGRLELATFKPVEVSRVVSPYNRQAWCSVFFLAWLPRKHRCVQFLMVNRDLPCVPYSVWQLGSEACKFGASTQCNLQRVVWRTRSENWVVLEYFREGTVTLETLEVSFEQQTVAVIPAELRQLVRRSADGLQIFSISMSSQWDVRERLGDLAVCRSLVELDITLPDATSSPEAIARILSSEACSALRKLSFIYPSFSIGDCAFAEALRENRSLLEVHIGSRSAEAFRVVCDALTKNTTVRKLFLTCIPPGGKIMTPDDKIASLLHGNTVLESLTLTGFSFFVACSESIAYALVHNDVLKFLTCGSGAMLALVASQVVLALAKNKTLQRIQLDAIVGCTQHKRAFAALVAHLECSRRLEVQRWDNDILTLLPLLAAPLGEPRNVWLPVDDIRPSQASTLRSVLAEPGGVPVRKLCLNTLRRWPRCVKNAIKDILMSNSFLESLEIAEDVRYFDLGAYCQDLAEVSTAVWRSSNLSHLTILSTAHLNRAEYAKWLVAVLRNSKSIVSLTICQQLPHYSAERAFGVMAMGLLLNPFVVEINVDGPVQDSRDYIFSRTVTRNRTRVNDAVRFVTGADTSPRCARAFELLQTKQSLLHLITRVTRGTENDARAVIRAAHDNMRENFLRSAGVVKSAVTCWPADVTQIDALNADCWHAISRYLKLHDVLVYQ